MAPDRAKPEQRYPMVRLSGSDAGSSAVNAGIQAGSTAIVGGLLVGQGIGEGKAAGKNPTDPALVQEQLAARAKVGTGVSGIGSATMTAGAFVPMPIGAVVMGVGAAITGVGALLAAKAASADPVEIAASNLLQSQGRSKTFSKEYADLIGLTPEEVRDALSAAEASSGGKAREREAAARQVLAEQDLATATQIVQYGQAQADAVQQQAELARQTVIQFGALAVLTVILIGLVWWGKLRD